MQTNGLKNRFQPTVAVIGACGGAGPRVEGAFLSGIALAENLLALDE